MPTLTRLPHRLRAWWPAPVPINGAERWRVAIGVGLGLLVSGGLSQWAAVVWGQAAGAAWLVAPLGASAVLVFGLPASP